MKLNHTQLRQWLSKLKLFMELTRQHRPIGTMLLLGSTSWGLIVAGRGQHDAVIISVFVVCAWLMRSAGCIINDYADRELDKHVQRTSKRPITTGNISTTEALGVFLLLCSLAAGLCLTFLRIEVFYATIPCLILIIAYPWMKRLTWWPQLVLAMSFSTPIPMAFLAYLGHLPTPAWTMFVLSAIWIFCYDTLYAMADIKDDEKIAIKSSARRLGQNTLPIVAALQWLFLLGWAMHAIMHNNSILLICLLACLGLFIYQLRLCHQAQQHQQTELCIRAFHNNHWIGWVIALGLLTF